MLEALSSLPEAPLAGTMKRKISSWGQRSAKSAAEMRHANRFRTCCWSIPKLPTLPKYLKAILRAIWKNAYITVSYCALCLCLRKKVAVPSAIDHSSNFFQMCEDIGDLRKHGFSGAREKIIARSNSLFFCSLQESLHCKYNALDCIQWIIDSPSLLLKGVVSKRPCRKLEKPVQSVYS